MLDAIRYSVMILDGRVENRKMDRQYMDEQESLEFLIEFAAMLMDIFTDMPCSLSELIDEDMLEQYWALCEQLNEG